MVKEKTIEEKNIAYFQELANSRASLTRLGMAPAAIFIIGIILPMFYSEIEIGREIYTVPFYIFISLTILLILISISSLFKKMLYKFQVLFSYILVGFVLILLLSIMGLGYLLSIADFTKGYGFIFPNNYTLGLFYASIILVIICLGLNIALLCYRLKIGFSEKRTNKNHFSVSDNYRSENFWIIFGVVTIVSQVFTTGKFFVNTIGLITIIFFGPVFTSPIVEFSYLAYLKSKDKTFWEEQPKIMPIKLGEKKKLRNKLIIGLYIVLSILYFYLIDKVYGEQTYPPLIRIFGLLILISYVVLLIAWIITKIKERRNK